MFYNLGNNIAINPVMSIFCNAILTNSLSLGCDKRHIDSRLYYYPYYKNHLNS